GYSLSGGAVD
uniref:Sperm-activating peptide (Tyr-2, Ser-3,5, Ala-8, Asp-10 SAP-I) n=1 Tax=Echinometra mathaei TaxID=31178 RepID=Q7M4C1_ECHMA|nr:sperm-activating peptide I (2-Tyr,3,5-Ser,8-Ala,10-Asp) [Echinometra mathaei]